MALTMSRTARNEYLEKMRKRYRRRVGKSARGQLIDEFCEVTGHERKYAIKLLGNQRSPSKSGRKTTKKRGVAKTYGEEVVKILYEIWRYAEQPCGKRLKTTIALWMPFYERRKGEVEEDVRKKALKISCPSRRRKLG